MKAERAVADHAAFGGAYVAAGCVALVIALNRYDAGFGVFAAVLAVAFVGTAVFMIVTTVRELRTIETLGLDVVKSPRGHSVIAGAAFSELPLAAVTRVHGA